MRRIKNLRWKTNLFQIPLCEPTVETQLGGMSNKMTLRDLRVFSMIWRVFDQKSIQSCPAQNRGKQLFFQHCAQTITYRIDISIYCISIFIYLLLFTYIYVSIHKYLLALCYNHHIYIHIYIYLYLFLSIYIYLSISIHLSLSIYKYIPIYLYLSIFIQNLLALCSNKHINHYIYVE